MIKKVFIFLFVFSMLLSCDWRYRKISEKELAEYDLTIINDNIDFQYYKAVKDLGPPVNTISFAVIKKNGNFYKVNPKYGYSIFKDNTLLLWHHYTMEVNENGNWIYIKNYKINGNKHIQYSYDTIPNFNPQKLEKEGVYRFYNNHFEKIGKLTDNITLYSLEEEGFYYLCSPGIFYSKKINSDEL